MMAVHDPNDDDDEAPHPLITVMRQAIDAAINSPAAEGYDIAFDLCVALLCCGSFASNVKLLADIDDMMAEDDDDEEVPEVVQ